MGGDGGVIASNRKYLRGAGTADHTGDSQRHADKTSSDKQVSQELMSLCYLTKAPLFTKQAIVADPYGRLYHKEAAVEALLRRKHTNKDEFGPHVRGIKDLMDVHFQMNQGIPCCPVTGVELNGQHPALLIRNRSTGINVISERAIKEMGATELQAEYGPFDPSTHLLRLAPPPAMMPDTIEAVRIQQERDQTVKLSKKDKKRKLKHHDDVPDEKKQNSTNHVRGESTQMKAARQRVQIAVQSDDVLSSLFTDNSKTISDKERHDTLFARMG